MYEDFFHLDQFPFPTAVKPERYFPAAAIETARQKLQRVIERSEGPGLLVGPAGTGKTLLLAVLAEQFRESFQIVLLSRMRLCSRRALLQAMLYELRLPYRNLEEGELRLSLIDRLTSGANQCGTLLLVDEAHALPLRLLEEIRLMTNLTRDGQPCVHLVLAGLPALEEKFASPQLDAFNQRIAARCYLDRLAPHDTPQYVRALLAASGGNPDTIFSPEAIQAIHRTTGGIPRLINQVCDHALVLACAGGQRWIGSEGIEEAWADLQQLPLPNNSGNRPERQASIIEFGELSDGVAGENPDALPFQLPPQVAVDERLQHIEQQLADLNDEFIPRGEIGPETELNFTEQVSPFSQGFTDEEIVIDRYASLDDEFYRDRQRVRSRVVDSLGSMLEAFSAPSRRPPLTLTTGEGVYISHPAEQQITPEPQIAACNDPVFPEPVENENAPPSQLFAQMTGDDRDLIIVEEDPLENVPTARVRRQEYKQLFSKLRQGQ